MLRLIGLREKGLNFLIQGKFIEFQKTCGFLSH